MRREFFPNGMYDHPPIANGTLAARILLPSERMKQLVLAAFRLIPFATVLAGCGARTGLETPDADPSAHVSSLATDAALPSDAAFETGGADVVGVDAVDETAESIVTALNGLRWELPCVTALDEAVCTTLSERHVQATLRGSADERYAVTLRFRGVVETKDYSGGTNDGAFWQVGGVPGLDTINDYQLTISSPLQQYHLNRRTADVFACVAIDYEETLLLDTGATVTLDALSEDSRQLRNRDTSQQPIVVPGVSPAPLPYDGQFVQMDVVALVRVR